MGESGDGLFFLFSDSRRFSPDSFVFPLIAYRLSLIAYRLSLIAYRLSSGSLQPEVSVFVLLL